MTWAKTRTGKDSNPKALPVDPGTAVCHGCKRVFVSAVGFGSLVKNGVYVRATGRYEYFCMTCKRNNTEVMDGWVPMFTLGVYVSRSGNTVELTREERDRVMFIRDGVMRSSAKGSFKGNYKLVASG